MGLKFVIQYGKGGGDHRHYFVGNDLQEVTSKDEAKVWDAIEADNFVRQPGFKEKYGPYFGVLHADERMRQMFNDFGMAIARKQGRSLDADLL